MVCLLSSQGVGATVMKNWLPFVPGSGVGHGKLSRLVVPQRGMEFVAETIAGVAGSRSQRASALNHELRNHAVEDQAVVKRPLHFLPVRGSLNSLVPSARPMKFADGLRRFLFEQAEDDRPLRSFEYGICSWCAAQDFLLWKAKCAGIIAHSARRGQHCARKATARRIFFASAGARLGVKLPCFACCIAASCWRIQWQAGRIPLE